MIASRPKPLTHAPEPMIGLTPARLWTASGLAMPNVGAIVEIHMPGEVRVSQIGLGTWDGVCWRDYLAGRPVRHAVSHWKETDGPANRVAFSDCVLERDKKPIGLIMCCGPKKPHASPARDLYQSPLFEMARRYVERECDEWCILSALYGLVTPDRVIEPYDVTLKQYRAWQHRQWGDRARGQIQERWPQWRFRRFLVLAGEDYRIGLGCFNCDVPMRGLGIGNQLKWLRVALETT